VPRVSGVTENYEKKAATIRFLDIPVTTGDLRRAKPNLWSGNLPFLVLDTSGLDTRDLISQSTYLRSADPACPIGRIIPSTVYSTPITVVRFL